jgi:type I restriction enzyme S subunit
VVDFGESGIDRSGIKFIDESVQQRIARYTILDTDIYVSIAGTIGRVGLIPEDLSGANLTENAAKITGICEAVDPRYLMYFLRGPAGQGAMRNQTGGTSQPKLALYRIEEIRFPCPSLNEQKAVSRILSEYDGLIENNRRRIVLLEEAARMLYREWFLRFRFPGHEHVKITDGIPDGWEWRSLIALAEVVMGQSPKSQFYNETGDGLPFHQGVTDYGFRFVSHRIFSSATTKVAEAGDILISVRAPVGRINITQDKIVLGRGLAAVRSRSGHQSFLFYALRNHFHAEDIIGTGAIYAATNKKELENQDLLEPPPVLLREFEDQASTIDRQITCLTAQNEKLARARDLLLPRLMNGEIAV